MKYYRYWKIFVSLYNTAPQHSLCTVCAQLYQIPVILQRRMVISDLSTEIHAHAQMQIPMY